MVAEAYRCAGTEWRSCAKGRWRVDSSRTPATRAGRRTITRDSHSVIATRYRARLYRSVGKPMVCSSSSKGLISNAWPFVDFETDCDLHGEVRLVASFRPNPPRC